jgi:tetratricopeptide (TPR) repeat protein
MKVMCKYIRPILLASFMLCGAILFAQESKLVRAQALYNEKKVDQAKLCIDSVVTHPETAKRYEAWTIRGFVYYELYKRSDKNKFESSLRDTVIASLKQSNKLNPDADYKSQNSKPLAAISGHYHSMAKTYLFDQSNYDMSMKAYSKFRELSKLADSTVNLKDRDVEFNLAAGSHFSQKFNENKKDIKSFEIAKVTLMKVLELNPGDTSANMNMGVMYLNQSTNLIEMIDAGETSLSDIDAIQDNAIKLAKQAEQFFLKVYNQNPKNKKAVLALYYVYRILFDKDKMLAFEQKCKELKIQVTDDPQNQQKK